jgi:uncharacterized protein YceK
MKRRLPALATLACVTAVALLSGCASIRQAATSEVDAARVARIEQAARQMGTTVIWVNYPMRTVDESPHPARK